MKQNNSNFFFTYGEINTLEQFTTIMKNVIQSEHPDYVVKITSALRNNDHELIGLSISEAGKKYAPNMRLFQVLCKLKKPI